MKLNKLLPLLGIASMSLLLSCETTECADCSIIVEDESGKVISNTPKGEYCGDALDAKEAEEPEYFDGKTSYYRCTSSLR